MFRCRKTNKPHDELAYQQSLARRRAPGPRQPVKTQWKTVAGFREISVATDRWQIESFFKSLKQLLRVKAFVGTSPNALKTQIWTAWIAMLLLKYLQLRSTFGWSLSNLCALLGQQLFVYTDLFPWLNDPFQPPPALDDWYDRQLSLVWSPSKLDSCSCQPAPRSNGFR